MRRIALLMVLVVAAVVGCGGDGDELGAATELVDEWVAGWNAADPTAVAAVFTEDASYKDPNTQMMGRSFILGYAEIFTETIVEVRRIGAGQEAEGGVFVFPISFDYDYGDSRGIQTEAGEIEVELAGDLLSRLEWLYMARQN